MGALAYLDLKKFKAIKDTRIMVHFKVRTRVTVPQMIKEISDTNVKHYSVEKVRNPEKDIPIYFVLDENNDGALITTANEILVQNCHDMFYMCTNMLTADLRGLRDISTDMSNMFCCCEKLQYVTFPVKFGRRVKSTCQMFHSCKRMGAINLPPHFGEQAFNMMAMFYGCASLESIRLPKGFGKSAVFINDMFHDCSTLRAVGLNDNFGGRATFVSSLFEGCKNLKALTLNKRFNCKYFVDATNMLNTGGGKIELNASQKFLDMLEENEEMDAKVFGTTECLIPAFTEN